MYRWLIFTDLDGTLLGHDNYRFDEALPILEKIQELNIPLIINSSKTYAEIKTIRQQLHNNWAFVVENGAAVFLPNDALTSAGENYQQVILGKSIDEILAVLDLIKRQTGYKFLGFSDFTVEQLMQETGLSESQARQAKQRLASEPLKWLDTEINLIDFKKILLDQGFQLVQGGRFYHVMGQNDKGSAMAWLLNNFEETKQAKTIALGDSMNDLIMLQTADFAGVIRKMDGSWLPLEKQSAHYFCSESPAPLGWKEVMEQMFVALKIGE